MSKRIVDVTAFATQVWLIEPNAAQFILAQLIAGTLAIEPDETPVVYGYEDYSWYPTARQAGSTAVMTISGVIDTYSAQYYCNILTLILNDPNVSSVIVKINSPGGLVNAGYKVADRLRNADKPTLAFIDYGMAASAAYMIACSCDLVWASRAQDSVGSIGTCGTYQDWSKYYEKMGVVSKEMYADQSTEKNSDGREARKGNFKPIQESINQEADRFIAYVQGQRSLTYADDMDPMKGRLFTAEEGKSIGLLDDIGTFQQAITAVRVLVPTDSATNSTNTDDMFGFMKSTAFDAVKGIAAGDITDAQLTAINEQLAASGYENVLVISSAQLDTATAQAAQVTALTSQVATLTAEKATLATTEATLTAEVARLGKQSGATPTLVQQEGGATEAVQTDATLESTMAALPHNQSLDSNPLFHTARK